MHPTQHILLVDDDPFFADFMKAQTNLYLKYVEITSTGSIRHATKALSENEFDLVFVDYHLDATSGLELVARLAKINERPDYYILSGEPDTETLNENAPPCVVAALQKPLHTERLRQLLADKAARTPKVSAQIRA